MNEEQEDIIDTLQSDWKRESPDLDTFAMGVVGRIIHLSSLLEADANRVLRPFGLQYTEFDVLATLRRKGKPYQLTPKLLRKGILITSGAMTACLDRLEKPNLIVRKPNPNDRRGTIVQLTPKGKSIVQIALAARFALAREHTSNLSKKDAITLSHLLKSLVLVLDNRR